VRRIVVLVAAGLMIGLSSVGCDFNMTSNDHTVAEDCDPVSYDLTTPPSRAEVGMEPGKDVVDKSCDAGFETTLALPTEETTALTARRVDADSRSAADPANDPPTTMDVHSVALGPEQAMRVASGIADDVGIDVTPLLAWEQRVEGAGGGDSVDSPFLRTTLGYLTFEMQVQHLGTSGNNYVHLVLSWG